MGHFTHDDLMSRTILRGRQPHPTDGTGALLFIICCPTVIGKVVLGVIRVQFFAHFTPLQKTDPTTGDIPGGIGDFALPGFRSANKKSSL